MNPSGKTPKVKLQRIKVQPKSVNPLGEKTKNLDLLVIDSSVKNSKKFKTDSLSPLNNMGQTTESTTAGTHSKNNNASSQKSQKECDFMQKQEKKRSLARL